MATTFPPWVFSRPCSFELSDIHNHTTTTIDFPAQSLLPKKSTNQTENLTQYLWPEAWVTALPPSLAVYANTPTSQMAIGLIHRNVLWGPMMCPIFKSHPHSSSWEEINTARQFGRELEFQSCLRVCSLDY